MTLFSDWLRPQSTSLRGKASGGWKQELAELDSDVASAAMGFEGTPLNRAGDLCHKAGDQARALQYYGRAIDAMLKDGRPESARGVAKKILRIHPEAVRALCTLTWLDLAFGHTASAMVHVDEYVGAAIRGGRQSLAGDQIEEMARIVSRPEFLEAAAEALDRLGFPDAAARVHEWALVGGSPEANTEPDALAEICRRAAIGSNAALKADGAAV